jgi:hypothetical protein
VSGDKIAYFRDLDNGDRVNVTYLRSKYFFDPLTDTEQDKFVESYHSQIPDFLKQVDPVNIRGEGVVQLGHWPYTTSKEGIILPPAGAPFFRYVADWKKEQKDDISDEAWMAQEDLWIQREIYRIIREANDSVSIFEGKGGDAKGAVQAFTFTNPYWELTLTVAGKKKLGVKIKNRLPWRQRLDLNFQVQLQKNTARKETIFVGGEPLEPHKERELKDHDVQGQAATGIYGVEQVINWETAAVKRIDHISFGSLAAGDCAHGHRTFPEGLKPFREQKDKGPPQPGPGPGPGPGLPPDAKVKMPMDKGKGEDKGETLNGLKANRYIEKPTQQTRRIPIGVALIVDQEHVDRVLLAFSKSPLRFLTTQVIGDRYPQSVRPQMGNMKQGGKGFNPKDFSGGGELSLTPGFGPGSGGFRNQPKTSSGGADQESNMELVIYGIVTLYERYPPRPKTP